MRRLLDRIAAFVSWHRRAVGALLAASALLLTAHALTSKPPTVAALALKGPIAAGERITAEDLAEVDLPADSGLALLTREEVVGQASAVALDTGALLQPGLLAQPANTPPGRAVVPISIADEALRSLLAPGDGVTLVMLAAESADVLTNDARVAALPRSAEGEGRARLALSPTADSKLVLVEVSAELAPTVAALGQSGQLSIVLGSI